MKQVKIIISAILTVLIIMTLIHQSGVDVSAASGSGTGAFLIENTSPNGINVREKPTTSSGKLGAIASKAVINAYGIETEKSGTVWYKIKYGGQDAYVMAEYFVKVAAYIKITGSFDVEPGKPLKSNLTLTDPNKEILFIDWYVDSNKNGVAEESERWREGKDAPISAVAGMKYFIEIGVKWADDSSDWSEVKYFQINGINYAMNNVQDYYVVNKTYYTVQAPVEYTGKCGDDVTYTFLQSNGLLVIAGKGSMWDFDKMESGWEGFKSEIKDVKIGLGVTSIGRFAFYKCSNLTHLSMPVTVTNVKADAFTSTALSTVDYGASEEILKSVISGNSEFDRATKKCKKVIKGNCQIPYGMIEPGQGGYLIGLETYPGTADSVEMLILDCTTMQWVYTTNPCKVPENMLWTVWQPQYGYYWTLFRAYDKYGNMIDQVCYGFQNI